MNHNMPGLPVHHQLPEFTQTHVHRVGDAMQPSHPLLSPSPPAPNPSQHQSLFQWVNSSHEVAKVMEFQLYHLFFDNVQFTLIHRPNILDLYQHYSLLHWTLLSLPDTSTADPFHGSQLCHGKGACVTQWSYEPCHAGPLKTDVSYWRVLTKRRPLEEGLAKHSSILAWKIAWTEEPGVLQSMGSRRVRHDWAHTPINSLLEKHRASEVTSQS